MVYDRLSFVHSQLDQKTYFCEKVFEERSRQAEVVKLVDTHVSEACVREDMRVRVPPSAQSGMGVGVRVSVGFC